VLIKSDILRIRDGEQQLLAKVQRSRNRLYLLDLKAGMPEEPWLWHAQFSHLSLDALRRLEKMLRVLPHIEHAG
jgi:hypothetical protein